jgi:hypothetical protein
MTQLSFVYSLEVESVHFTHTVNSYPASTSLFIFIAKGADPVVRATLVEPSGLEHPDSIRAQDVIGTVVAEQGWLDVSIWKKSLHPLAILVVLAADESHAWLMFAGGDDTLK